MLNLKFTEVPIPMVINAKNITNSSGLFTGFLNLTIDKAPIIPSDKAKFPAIKVVTIIVITGNKQKVKVWWYVKAQSCLAIDNEYLMLNPHKIERSVNNIYSKKL